jgi:hypothetical protein
VAEAYAWRLGIHSSRWILGGAGGPRSLALDLERLTKGWEEPRAGLFYRMAGQAAARTLREPYAALGLSAESWPWRMAMPAPFHAAFEAGLGLEGSRP